MKTDIENKEFAALGFGEVMMRLSPVGQERIITEGEFVKHAGGSELNVVSGISRLGLRCGLISKLPTSAVGRYVRNTIRSYGVSDDYVISDESRDARLGIYYYEGGGYPRKPQVIYDRANSSFTTLIQEELEQHIYQSTALFHTSGISLALRGDTTMGLVKSFKQAGAVVSFDVNFRANLWEETTARRCIEQLLPYVDILFVSEETSRRMLGRKGTLEDIQREFCKEYGVQVIASTRRIINSPSSHTFSSLLYAADTDTHYTERPYENIEVVDRIGSGDAYVSGVLYALLSQKSYQETVALGNALSAVKNTVPGDMLATDLGEIESVIADHNTTGRVSEMNR